MNLRETAAKLGIRPTTLHRWKEKYDLLEGTPDGNGSWQFTDQDVAAIQAKTKVISFAPRGGGPVAQSLTLTDAERCAGIRRAKQRQMLLPIPPETKSKAKPKQHRGTSRLHVRTEYLDPVVLPRFQELRAAGWKLTTEVEKLIGRRSLTSANLHELRSEHFRGAGTRAGRYLYHPDDVEALRQLWTIAPGLLRIWQICKRYKQHNVRGHHIRTAMKNGMLVPKARTALGYPLFDESDVQRYIAQRTADGQQPKAKPEKSKPSKPPPVVPSPPTRPITLPPKQKEKQRPTALRQPDPGQEKLPFVAESRRPVGSPLPLVPKAAVMQQASTGWCCSLCGRSYAPHVTECAACNATCR